MAFFEDLGKKVSQTSQNTLQKAKDTAEIIKLNGMILEEEKKIKSMYAEIGKKYFEIYADCCDAIFAGMVNEIKMLQDNVDAYNEQIEQLKSIGTCPHCGGEVGASDIFCTNCGQKIISEPPAPRLCANCGNDVGDSKFCTQCGMRIDAEPPVNSATAFQNPPPQEKFCTNCGQKAEGNAAFCVYCGVKL